MEDIYITISGAAFRYGIEFLEKGMTVKLVKEPDNQYDSEVTKIELKLFGTIGYVANSVKTVIGECYSAGRLYDKIENEAEAEIACLTDNFAIAKVKG